MNNLTTITHNGQKTIDSREVAEMVDKQHRNLLADIRGYITAILLKLKSVVTVQRMCRSREWRKNKIARKIGREWRIDVGRYQKWWAGELK